MTSPAGFRIIAPVDVDARTVVGLLCCAFEGGSNYWVRHIAPVYGPGVTKDDLADMLGGGWHWSQLLPLLDGCAVEVTTADDATPLRLDRAALERGLQLMTTKHPGRYAEAIGGGDAETGDVFLQLCVLGELTYG